MIDFSGQPYFDDFSEDNKFYRILFRPSVAVQARELNQIQSILQNQIKRHGDHIFKNGAVVIPGEFSINNKIDYVKLTATTDVTGYIGTMIKDANGVQALIVHATNYVSAGEPATFFLSYTSSSTSGTISKFVANASLTNLSGTAVATVVSSSPTGLSTLATVQRGVYYVNGHFVLCEKQTLVVDKYNANTLNNRIGFSITEETITPDDIGYDSLLDNAQGSPNYGAPGAHRYFIDLSLVSISTTIGTNDSNFVELARIVGSDITYIKDKTEYAELEKTLARRTYDESGNYVVSGFDVDVREHRDNNRGAWSSSNSYLRGDVVTNSGNTYVANKDIASGGVAPTHTYSLDASGNWIFTTNPYYNRGIYSVANGGDATKLAVGFSTGKAYVQGYEVEKVASTYVPVSKPRANTAFDNNASVATSIGSYIIVSNVNKIPSTIDTAPIVYLYDTVVSTPGTVAGNAIGQCRIRGVQSESTNARLYIFDVQMYFNSTVGANYDFSRNVKSIGLSASNFTANLTTDTYSKQLSGVITVSSGSPTTVSGVGTKFTTEVRVGDTIYWAGNTAGTKVTGITNDSTLSCVSTTSVTNSIGFLQLTSVVEPLNTSLVFPVPHIATQKLSDHIYWVIQNCSIVSASGTQLTISAGTNGVFESDATQFYVLNASGAQVSPSVVSGGGTSNVVLECYTSTTTSWVVFATVKKTAANSRRTKTLTTASKTFTLTSGAAISSVLKLDNTDIVSIVNVMSNSIDIKDNYTLDNGQRDTHYDYGSLNLIAGCPVPTADVTVYYQYFAHNAGDFFDVGSYVPSTMGGTAPENYYDIVPYYGGINLRDCVDFRPDINGAVMSSFRIPKRGYNMSVDVDFYLGRSDKIAISPQGVIYAVTGSPSNTPSLPDDPSTGMVLCNLEMAPYTFNSSDIKFTKLDNRRYTMRDIGKLEKRIDNLEYYTSLSLLEQETSNMLILDQYGLNRFKNGFIVDNFSGHNVGDTTSPDYVCSIDMEANELRPFTSTENVGLVLSSGNAYGELVTLPIANHVELAKNSYASRVENVNPFAVFTFLGDVKLNPASDDWFEVDRRPDIVQNEDGNFDTIASLAEKAGVIGTVWNAWQTQWSGTPITSTFSVSSASHSLKQSAKILTGNTTKADAIAIANQAWGGNRTASRTSIFQTTATQVGQSRTGVKTSLVSKVDTKVIDDRILSSAIIPYIRTRNVLVQTTGLKPVTKFYPYFDNVDVSSYCTPATVITYTPGSGTFDITTNVGSTVNTDVARRINGDSQTCLNTGDVITNGTATAVVVGKDVYTPVSGSAVYRLYVVNVIGTFAGGNTITGSLSSATGTIVSVSTPSSLITSENGSLFLLFNIPNTSAIRFRTGSREFKLIDAATYNGTFTSRGRANYTAAGVLETKQATVVATRNADLVQESVSDDQTIIQSSVRVVRDTGWYDPLAQSFLVDSTGGAFLSKVDLFFAAKDSNIPVTIEIREMVNGYPGKNVLPFSRVTIQPSQVNLSATTIVDNDGNNYPTFDTATTITFPSPVYVMDKTEYALVVMSDSNNYRVWISQLGDTIPNTSNKIAEQPYNGVLFKSQNASTWTADQMQDLKFTLYRANFSSSGTATLTNARIKQYNLETNPFQSITGSKLVRVWHKNHGFTASDTVTFRDTVTANGITVAGSTAYAITNLTLDSYVITTTAGSGATATGFFGGSSVFASRYVRFETIQPNLNVLSFPDTTANYSMFTTGYDGTTQTDACVINDNNYYLSQRVIKAPGSLTLTVGMSTANTALSPVIDLGRASVIATTNKIDKPDYTNMNTVVDKLTILGTSSTFSFSGTTITTTNATAMEKLKSIVAGSYIEIASATTAGNNGITYVTKVDIATGSVTLTTTKTFTNESAGGSTVLYYYASYFSEITPVGSSSTSKYVTPEIQLAQQSSTIKVRLAANVPTDADILLYYKTGVNGTTFSNTNWTLLSPEKTISKTSIDSDAFYDTDYTVTGLPLFDKLAVKIVFQSTNTAAAPRVKDLRIIACA